MQKKTDAIKPEHIIEIALKRRWYIIIPFCLSMLTGIYLAVTLPRLYESKTLIFVQPQRVPTDFVRSIISVDIDSRIRTISQQILSRTNLEKIIENFNLFSEPKLTSMFMEDKVGDLRKRIRIDVTKAKQDRRKDADAFSISFKGKDPEKVMRIANALATYFIDENLKVREAQAVGTSDFLKDELGSMRNRLVALEESLRKYRVTYMGELPEQLETNLRILDRLQDRLNTKQESLRAAKSAIVVLEKQISDAQELYRGVTSLESGKIVEHEMSDQAKLNLLKKERSDLLARYTDRHPDIIRQKKIIDDLEAKIQNENQEAAQELPPGQANNKETFKETSIIADKYTSTLMKQRLEIINEIKIIQTDIAKLTQQSHMHQKRVENTPKREQELLSLKRDYQNIKDTYDSLLSRKLEAELAVNMEKKQKGEQFRIIDPARLPKKPVSPDMKKLFLMTLAAGLGIGCVLVFLLEYLNTSFNRFEEIEPFLGIPVLATIPSIINPRNVKKRKISMALSIISIMFSFVLLAGFAFLTFNGVDQTKELLNRFIH